MYFHFYLSSSSPKLQSVDEKLLTGHDWIKRTQGAARAGFTRSKINVDGDGDDDDYDDDDDDGGKEQLQVNIYTHTKRGEGH